MIVVMYTHFDSQILVLSGTKTKQSDGRTDRRTLCQWCSYDRGVPAT
jgi:hypothetical protein